MKITTQCTNCRKTFKVDQANIGRKGKCPACQTTFVIAAVVKTSPPKIDAAATAILAPESSLNEYGDKDVTPPQIPTLDRSSRNRWIIAAACSIGVVVVFCVIIGSRNSGMRLHSKDAASMSAAETASPQIADTDEKVLKLEADRVEFNHGVENLTDVTYFALKAVNYERSGDAALRCLEEMVRARTQLPPSPDLNKVEHLFTSNERSMQAAITLLNEATTDQIEQTENNNRVTDCLREILKSTDRIVVALELDNGLAHGSQRFRESCDAFLSEAKRVGAVMNNYKATQTTDESVKESEQLLKDLRAKFIRIPIAPLSMAEDNFEKSMTTIYSGLREAVSSYGSAHGANEAAARGDRQFRDFADKFAKLFYSELRPTLKLIDIVEERLRLRDSISEKKNPPK